MTNDIVNALFELFGAGFSMLNVLRLANDKKIRGIYYPVWIFYTIWGIWNLWYYPSVNCWYSFLAGLLLVCVNSAWIILAIRYRNN
jgi:hypothetical protein